MTEVVVDWRGQSGRTYRYWMLSSTEPYAIKDEAGNYVFAKKLANGNFQPVYFGVASSLRSRIPNHEIIQQATRMGATFVMAHTTPGGETARLAEEADLIRHWNPALNTQHRTTG